MLVWRTTWLCRGGQQSPRGLPPGGAVSAPGTCWCCRSCKWVVTVSAPHLPGTRLLPPGHTRPPPFLAAQWLDTRKKLSPTTAGCFVWQFCFLYANFSVVNEADCWPDGYEMKPFRLFFFLLVSNRPLSGCNATNDPSVQNSSRSQRERETAEHEPQRVTRSKPKTFQVPRYAYEQTGKIFFKKS
jgi:hypothetical protein